MWCFAFTAWAWGAHFRGGIAVGFLGVGILSLALVSTVISRVLEWRVKQQLMEAGLRLLLLEEGMRWRRDEEEQG